MKKYYLKKFYPKEVIEKGYDIAMLHYLAYLFPDKKFSLREFAMYDAMFIKGYDEGYSYRVMEEDDERK